MNNISTVNSGLQNANLYNTLNNNQSVGGKDNQTETPAVTYENPAVVADINSDKPEKSDSGIYSREDINAAALEEVQRLNEQRLNSFQDFINKMLDNQDTAFKVSVFLPDTNEEGNLYGKLTELNPTEEDISAAKKSISEGGEYSVDAVATRIMDMAKALSGGDASKFEVLKNATQSAFDKVKQMYGDDTPQITLDTEKEVQKRFEEWGKELSSQAATTNTQNDIMAQAVAAKVANTAPQVLG
ncbi:MAG: hypothetical protein LBL93_07610 [Ruminococcus sp.]|jgi:hypothetical protein|nr:hypothetical protein [Ruminococcus sp.]